MSITGAATAQPVHGADRPRRRGRSTRTFRRLAAVLTSAALGLGIALVGAAAPASAHTNTITATAVCATGGKADITWTVRNSENVAEKITKSSNTKVVPVGTEIGRNGQKTFVQKGAAPGQTYKLELTAKWSNGNTAKSSASFTVPKSLCDSGGDTKITICHWTGGDKYQRLELTVSGLHNGHAGHGKDIYPAYSFTKNGKTYSSGPKGDQSLLQYANCDRTVKIAVPAKPSKQDTCGTAGDRIVPPALVDGVVWNITPVQNGRATATATTIEGYKFTDGTTSKTWEFTFESKPCVLKKPASPAAVDQCGKAGDRPILPELDHATWRVDGDATTDASVVVTAMPDEGYAFPKGAKTSWTLDFTDEACPPEVIALIEEPTGSDTCGPDNGVLEIPEVAEDAHYAFTWQGSEAEGRVVVTAVADEGYVFDAGQPTEWIFDYVNTPCIVLDVAPTNVDLCGVDRDGFDAFPIVEHVTWRIEGDVTTGSATVFATTDDGYFFTDESTEHSFPFEFTDEPCIEPTFAVAVATGVCEADAPWIDVEASLDDPDNTVTERTVFLVLSDGTETESIEVGELDDEGNLVARVLWPGASVAADGVTPTGWPGWEQAEDGTWVEIDGNFAWTRSPDLIAYLEVNPEAAVDLSYPPATPDCAAEPFIGGGGGDGNAPAAGGGGGTGLASTGFAGGTIAIIAGAIVVLGAAVLAVVAIRRRRAATAGAGAAHEQGTAGDSSSTE